MLDLFADEMPWSEPLAPGAVILRRQAREQSAVLLATIAQVAAISPFRQMVTPGGYTMSVAMTNCGPYGWSTDRHGYCYAAVDPLTGKPWPAMPDCFRTLAQAAATSPGQSCRCIRTKMRRGWTPQLSPSRSVCLRPFSLVA